MPLKKFLLACLAILTVFSFSGFAQVDAAQSIAAVGPEPGEPGLDALQEVTNPVYLPIIGKQFPFTTVFGVELRRLNNANGLDKAAAAQATWTRRNALLWDAVETTEGSYGWSAVSDLEQELIDASSNGIEVILVVRSTPAWAQQIPGKACGPVKADKLAAFGDFLEEAVKRYSVAPFNVRYWQIWNEPDVDPGAVDSDSPFGCWGDPADTYYGGDYYGEMLATVYPRIKSAFAGAKVIVGGLLLDCNPNYPDVCSHTSGHYLEGILRRNGANDGANYFDIVGFHAYDDFTALGQYQSVNWKTAWNTSGPALIAKAAFLRQVLASYGAANKPLMITELALRCGTDATTPACIDGDFETTKAYYIAQAFSASIAHKLQASIWFSMNGPWRNTSLLNPDLTAKPAYQAFSVARDTLASAQFSGEIGAYPGVKGYTFAKDGKAVWVLWSLDGEPHTVTLPSMPASAIDALGNPVVVNSLEVTVDLNPTYYQW